MQLASSGGRRLSHAALAAGRCALEPERVVTRKELSATFRLAQEALGLRPSLRLVLGELVANWGEQAWDRLLVWPSNDHLVTRTGLSERAVRLALRALTELELIVPKDSPNGKRYAVRNSAGTVVDAYGFDLTPLFAKQAIWAERVAWKKAERRRIKQTFDAITVARRATEEAITALRERYPDAWDPQLETAYGALIARTPKRGNAAPSEDLLEAWMTLRSTVETVFFQAGNDGTRCRHIEHESDSYGEACNKTRRPSFEPELTNAVESEAEIEVQKTMANAGSTEITAPRKRSGQDQMAMKTGAPRLPDQLIPAAIEEACPSVTSYGGPLHSPYDVIRRGQFLRSMLGANETVWGEAVGLLGPLRAAVAVIFVMQLYEDDARRHGGESQIRNPGGYLRAFVRMVATKRIDLEADLLAMRRRRLTTERSRGGGCLDHHHEMHDISVVSRIS